MADGVTLNYDLTLPEVEGSDETWGEKLNRNFDRIDALLFNRVIKATGNPEGSEATNPQAMSVVLTLPAQTLSGTSANGLIGVHEATTVKWVEARIASMMNQFFPVGTIMMWGGSVASAAALAPFGWVLCHGNNGSPDMRSRAVLCANDTPDWGHSSRTTGGNIGPGFGAHIHATTAPTIAGVAGGTEVPRDYQGMALYAPGGSTSLPYIAICYIYKYTDFVA